MAIIGIHYGGGTFHDEEGNLVENPIKYREVYLHLCSGDEEYTFDSGDFVKDWFHAKKKFLEFHEEEVSLGASSTVDHFIMDGAPYDSAYLVFKDGNEMGELSYNEEDYKTGWEMFVPKGTTPTWEELKKYCKS